MLEKHPNIEQLEIVAKRLGNLKDEVTFVGGATVALYIEDEATWDPTPSDDIDCIVETLTQSDYSSLEKKLRTLGFRDPNPEEIEAGAPICRKYIGELSVDVMPVDPKILGFSNQWYKGGIENRIEFTLPSETKIYALSLPYFLATKLEAYFARGANDLRLSQDLEDIANVIDGINQNDITNQIKASETILQNAISTQLTKVLRNTAEVKEAIYGFIRSEERTERWLAIMNSLI